MYDVPAQQVAVGMTDGLAQLRNGRRRYRHEDLNQLTVASGICRAMPDYNLDALGWYQFERLMQSLLKAAVSPAIQATSGRVDHGRDAYCASPLEFPNRGELRPGPLVFQMKFVSGANSPGANPFPAIRHAVRAECDRIEARIDAESWITPRSYTLITNCPLGGERRAELATLLRETLRDAEIHVWAASDLDALLDNNPRIRLSFPQILGIRDLQALLHRVVRADTINRSQIQLELAADLARVFVPTLAHRLALNALDKHHLRF